MKRMFVKRRFNLITMSIINMVNEIVEEYINDNLKLTIRQLFYQFVSRGFFPNQQKKYDMLSLIVSRARLSGYIDWDAFEDRSRFIHQEHRWDYPKMEIKFKSDQWKDYPIKPEIWVEKDALSGIVERVCSPLCVDYLPCRGYPSQSALWSFYNRYFSSNQKIKILYIGDHDPTGLIISKNLSQRLNEFNIETKIKRIALNFDQIDKYKLHPNPAKRSDSNADSYIGDYGVNTWEVDALDPVILSNIIRQSIEDVKNEKDM